MEFLVGLFLGVLIGLGIAQLFHLGFKHTQEQLIERLFTVKAIAESVKPLDTSAAISDFQVQQKLNLVSPDVSEPPPVLKPKKEVLIDGAEFEFPQDSPLNKLL